MSAKITFKPFNILTRNLMMQILLETFKEDASSTLEIFLDYHKVSKRLSGILANQENFQHIIDSMPTEFNMDIYPSLKKRITTTNEGRYRAGAALLFLKHIYAHLKPFPDDQFITEHYDEYLSSLKYLQDTFKDSPMTMYIAGFVSFYIAKRLWIINPLDKKTIKRAQVIYIMSTHFIAQAYELEHPLAQIFYSDMQLQLERHNIIVADQIKEKLPETPIINFSNLLDILIENVPINIKMFDEETQTLLLVTWQKLIIEHYYTARTLFNFTYRNEKLLQITEYFYGCYQKNHFHRHILAFNPFFVNIEQKDNILYLLQAFNVDALITMFQGFRVTHPKPDSILLSTMLEMNMTDLKDFRTLASDFLALPQQGTPAWKVNFHDAYRDAFDDGSLKHASAQQMKMTLKYFSLVERARKLPEILDRDAEILNCVFHCNSEIIHNIALAVIDQLLSFNILHPLGQLHQQELILKLIYRDATYLSMIKIRAPHDFDRIATIINDTYAEKIAPELTGQSDLKVYDYLYNNRTKLHELIQLIHEKFTESGYLKAA